MTSWMPCAGGRFAPPGVVGLDGCIPPTPGLPNCLVGDVSFVGDVFVTIGSGFLAFAFLLKVLLRLSELIRLERLLTEPSSRLDCFRFFVLPPLALLIEESLLMLRLPFPFFFLPPT